MDSPTTEKRKWPGSMRPGVHGSDGDLVDARSLDGEERKSARRSEFRRRPGVVEHRVPVLRASARGAPVGAGWMSDRDDAVQVHHFALEPSGRKRQVRQRGNRRTACGALSVSSTRRSGRRRQEQVHDAQASPSSWAADQGEPVAGGQQIGNGLGEFVVRNLAAAHVLAHHRRSELAAAVVEQARQRTRGHTERGRCNDPDHQRGGDGSGYGDRGRVHTRASRAASGTGVSGQRGERDDDEQQRHRQHPGQPRVGERLAIDSSLANIANGGSPSSTSDADGE